MRRLTLGLALLFIAACTTPQTSGKEPYHPEPSKSIVFTPFYTPDYYEPLKSTIREVVIYTPAPIRLSARTDVIKPIKPKPKQRIKPTSTHRTGVKAYVLKQLGAKQFLCIEKLWDKESHWNYRSYNKNSGAYGIPQAVPGSKMASAGSDWKTNPITQAKWGIKYVNGRYGSACNAWNFWKSHNWY